MKRFYNLMLGVIGLGLIASCAKDRSTSTGWEYNNYRNGGFEKIDAKEQETGPGLVFIEGGTFTMGQTEQDVMQEWNNRASRFTVASFYMDRTEVTNFHWLEYMNWMKRVYYKSYPHIYKKCLPDTLSWRRTLGYREKYVNYYLRHPSYRDYPVVGVSWLQANDFCKWRTDRVNEAILVREGILKWHFADVSSADGGDIGAANFKDYEKKFQSMPENMFSTENYLNGNYMIENGTVDDKLNQSAGGYSVSDGKYNVNKPPLDKNKRKIPRDPYQLQNYDPVYADVDKSRLGTRPVRMEDGILLPSYRLPTEAEWEFAATGLIGNLDPIARNSENITERRIYPWNGHYVRDERAQFAGSIQANFVRGKGDFMGIAGHLNDGADVTCRVDDFFPNDYGLYHMAGNVSEWVMDVYRPLSNEIMEEFMPFRGNVYTTQLLVPDGLYDKPVKANENLYDAHGMKEFVNEYARTLFLNSTQDTLSDFQQPYADNGNGKYIKIESRTEKERFKNLVGDSMHIYIDFKTLDSDLGVRHNSPFEVNITSIQSGGTLRNTIWQEDTSAAAAGLIEVQKENNPNVELNSRSDKMTKDHDFDFIMDKPGVYNVALNYKGKTFGQTFRIYNTPDDKDPIKWNNRRSGILSRQNIAKYKYNSPSQEFIANDRNFSKTDSIKFTVLDDVNAILDTAIHFVNKGNLTKASHYLEVVLFGSIPCNDRILVEGDFAFLRDLNPNASPSDVVVGSVSFNNANGDQNTPIFASGTNFSKDEADHYLAYKFNYYNADPSIVTWILNLRNGLTEYVTETRGKQRWRNVTEEENAGRLNYRKDDYRDYMDGDLESSIYYNNSRRMQDINKGVRDPKQVMYQSKHENRDLENNPIIAGSAGWPTTLISDKSRVYKGGSWADKTYWMSAGNRRFLDEDRSSDQIGFRCAMDRVGSTRPNKKKR